MINTAINSLYALEEELMGPRLNAHHITEAEKMQIYHLHTVDGISSTDIARRKGWSQPTIMRVIREMGEKIKRGAGKCGRQG